MRLVGGIPQEKDREAFSSTMWGLIRVSPAWAVFTQFLNIRSISGHPKLLLAITPERDSRYLSLCVNYKHFTRLQPIWRWNWLKHVLSHIPNGHAASLGAKLVQKYGLVLSHIAFDLVINQNIPVDQMLACPFKMPSIKDFGFPASLPSWKYAEMLREHYAETPPDELLGQDWDIKETYETQNPEPGPWELVSDLVNFGDEYNVAKSDQASNAMIEAVDRRYKGFKEQGIMSVDIEDYIMDLREGARISWIQMVKQRVGSHERGERTISRKRLSRRHPSHFGRTYKRKVRVMFWVDTSASMGEKELRCVNAEAEAISAGGALLIIGHCDSSVCKVEEYKKGDKIDKFFGRGGTDFKPAFRHMKEMRDKPDFVVYFTDGYGSAPDRTDFDVVWVLSNDGRTPDDFRENVCSWGEIAVIDVKDDIKWLEEAMDL